jgi:hypothetical protein
MQENKSEGFSLLRRLWFMERPLPIRHPIVRVWKTGLCRFTDIAVNEHPIVSGRVAPVSGEMQHHDSPDLDHWLDKQNRYSTAEAVIAFNASALADTPKLFGTPFQRRMWLKRNFHLIPFRYLLTFLYYCLWCGTWRAGWVGFAWARLRSDVMRYRDYKAKEIKLTGRMPSRRTYGPGKPDARVRQYE